MQSLTPKQVQLIKSTAPALRLHGDEIATAFYDDVFAKAPVMNNVFNRSAQDNGHQAHAVAKALYAYASHIDDLGRLAPAFRQINSVHASMYVQPEQYAALEALLMGAMAQVLGSAFDDEVLAAWTAAYRQLAQIFTSAESEIYQAPASRDWSDWRELRILRKVKESDVITSFYLGTPDGSPLPPFSPGQFISVRTPVPSLGLLQSRQYSLSDAPRPDHYRISVKREEGAAPNHPGYVSNILHDEKDVGAVLHVSHPQGGFHLGLATPGGCPVVLIGAGVGVTPLLSMLNACLAGDSRRAVTVLLGSRDEGARAFHGYLKDVAGKHAGVRYTSFVKAGLSGEEGGEAGEGRVVAGRLALDRVDAVDDLRVDDRTAHYFVCGPAQFMTEICDGLVAIGVGAERVHKETFGPGEWPEKED